MHGDLTRPSPYSREYYYRGSKRFSPPPLPSGSPFSSSSSSDHSVDLPDFLPIDFSTYRTPERRSYGPITCPEAPRKRHRFTGSVSVGTQTELTMNPSGRTLQQVKGVCPICLSLFQLKCTAVPLLALKTFSFNGCNGCCKSHGEDLFRFKDNLQDDVPLLPYFE